MQLALVIGFYLIETVPVFIIAQKSGNPLAWFAFIPILNLWLLCDMADMEMWFLIIWCVPYLNILFLAWVWYRIAENTNKPGWLGLFMVVPLVNLVVLYYLAFMDTGGLVA